MTPLPYAQGYGNIICLVRVFLLETQGLSGVVSFLFNPRFQAVIGPVWC